MNISELKFEVSENVKALVPEQKLTSLVETFTQLDANHDGKIELNEYLNFVLAKEKVRLTKKFEAAEFRRRSDGAIFDRTGSQLNWVGRRVPEIMRIASFSCTSTRSQWADWNQTGAQYSATE